MLPDFIRQLDNNRFEMTLSPSAAQCFDLCEAKFSWNRITGIEAAVPHVGANYGKGVHVGMKTYYGTSEDVEAAILKHFKENPQPLSLSNGNAEWRTAARAIEALSLYREHYKNDDFIVKGVEAKFTIELGRFTARHPTQADKLVEVVVVMHGIKDLEVEWFKQDWIVDHKTSKDFGQSTIDEGEISWQFMSYTWAKRQITGSCAGVIGNYIIARPPFADPSRKPRANELPRNQFERHSFAYTDDAIAEWHSDAMETASRIWDRVVQANFHRNRNSCAHWGTCEFYKLCWQTNPDFRLAAALGADYRPRTPSPFEEENAKE